MLNDLAREKGLQGAKVFIFRLHLVKADDKLKNVMMTILYEGITQKYLVKMMILFNI